MNNKSLTFKEKDIYKLLNQVKFDEGEIDTADVDIGRLKRESIKRNLDKRIKGKRALQIIKFSSAAAIIGLVSLIGVGTINPVFAQNIPIINNITQIISDRLGHNVDYIKYSQLVGKSVTNNGVTITINDILADDVKIIIGYTIKSDKKIENIKSYGISRFLNINGKSFASGGSAKGYFVNEHTYIESEDIHIALPEGSDKFNVGLNITHIGSVEGKWDFAFCVSKSELANSSTVFTPNKKFEYPGGYINVNKVVFSPIDTSIFFSGKYKDAEAEAYMGTADYNGFFVYDDKGVQLHSNGGGGCTSNLNTKLFSVELSFNSSKEIPKYLTIIPFKYYHSDTATKTDDYQAKAKDKDKMDLKLLEESSKPIDGTYPIQLSQGNLGTLTINEINTVNNETIVKFTSAGKAPTMAWIYLSDTEGERVEVKSADIRDDIEKPYEFKWVFKELDASKKYRIGTDLSNGVVFREDLKFTVELNR